MDTSGIPGYGVVVMENKAKQIDTFVISKVIEAIDKQIDNVTKGDYYIEHGLSSTHVNCVGFNQDCEYLMNQPLWKAKMFHSRIEAEKAARSIGKWYDTCAYVFAADHTYISRLRDAQAFLIHMLDGVDKKNVEIF